MNPIKRVLLSIFTRWVARQARLEIARTERAHAAHEAEVAESYATLRARKS